MKQEKDSNGKSNASDSRPCAMLGAGNLAASLWKFGDEESGWRYRFNIFRMARTNGRVSHRFLPHDVADLAKLAQTLAFALSEEECLDRELRDDLGCLFACLSDVLPSTLDHVGRHPRLSDAAVTLLRAILSRYIYTEEQHFGANPDADHSYRLLLLVDRWLEGVVSPERVALPGVDFDSIREEFGVCPLCGNSDECVNLGPYNWYICRRHQFRWCIGHNRIVPEVYENDESYQENWERIRKYRVVEPLRPLSTSSRSEELTS